MRKDDLKVGYLVEIENMGQRLLAKVEINKYDELAISSPKEWFPVDSLDYDLTHYGNKIVKVYGRSTNRCAHMFSTEDRKLLWERKEITLTPAEKQLLELAHCHHKYVTRDEYGELGFHKAKPKKHYDTFWEKHMWYSHGCKSTELFNDLLPFITYKDEEPHSIEELLDNNDKG